jgi:branched-chain amino acid aminotransferase
VVVSPIKEIGFEGKNIQGPLLPGEEFGELTDQVWEWIQKIQYGDEEYKNWSHLITRSKAGTLTTLTITKISLPQV